MVGCCQAGEDVGERGDIIGKGHEVETMIIQQRRAVDKRKVLVCFEWEFDCGGVEG